MKIKKNKTHKTPAFSFWKKTKRTEYQLRSIFNTLGFKNYEADTVTIIVKASL